LTNRRSARDDRPSREEPHDRHADDPLASLVLAFALASAASAVPYWGAKEPMPAGTAPAALKPGEFTWNGDAQPSGPIVVVVSLTEQRAYVYRNGVRIGVTTVSSGKRGHQTPTGVFTVLQKDADHRSSKYNNAPMPYTERLTWSGVALHAGGLPGYPSSHGCIHLPSEFAKRLFAVSPMGMTVVVASEQSAPQSVVHPAVLAPVDAATGAAASEPRLGADEETRWQPEKSPEGPVTILVSAADRRILVYRNGVEIGRAKIAIRDPQNPFGTRAYTMVDPDPSSPTRWISVGIPGHMGEDKQPLDPEQRARVTIPRAFLSDLRQILAPGATLAVTDFSVLEQTTGVPVKVLDDNPPEAPR
jgi:lipoprotein-anchoring transpeptidase ErfK/SrfK